MDHGETEETVMMLENLDWKKSSYTFNSCFKTDFQRVTALSLFNSDEVKSWFPKHDPVQKKV